MPPKVLARNADRQGGVLPVPAAARSTPKQPAARLKLEVRRLPPGLTLTEFEETLGDEWKLNNGKVDWREYRQGKTRAPGSGKWPEQSRCYVHLVNEACVGEFEKRFLEVVFHDKAGTYKNPDLKHLQPALGYAPNQRTPLQQAKNRTDNRQGTIDQDPEFIAFLEAETQPITKPSALDVAGSDKENEKKEVKTTPLIEDLRERKANKAKAAQAKEGKAEKEKKDKKGAEKEAEKEKGKDGKGSQQQQQKVEQAAKDAAKVLNKQAAGKQQQAQQSKQNASPAKSKKQAAAQQSPKQQNANPVPTGPANPAPQRGPQRQRGNAEGMKKLIQKDLGLAPQAEQSKSPSPNASKGAKAQTSPASQATPPAKPAPQAKAAQPTNAPAQSTPDAKPTASPQTKAYLKHANPSQGMTEMLIRQALSQYGEMNNVTIDPRKGTAIAVFKTNEGLKKALEAKKVGVANGAVEVLEFRERGGAAGGGGAGGGGGGGGRGGFRGRGGRGGRGGGAGGAGNAGNAGNAGSPAPAANTAAGGQ